jgi:formate dehydrogenase major subunit
MDKVRVRIDGVEYELEPGRTILEVCRSLGIDIPTLCYHERLSPLGACRVCIVEVNGAIKTSCTTPIADGMEIVTSSERLDELRRRNVELLFVERNHYCMYCEMTGGDCELQALGYRFGMDHFPFSTYERTLPVDTSHPFILVDHNRCVLCRRCVRACSELAGHAVLFEAQRGIDTKIIADVDLPLGDSSCVSCGVCVQVCPTGALVDKTAAYLGKEEEAEVIKSACFCCPVGCGTLVYKRRGANYIVKVYGDWDSEVSGGLLCVQGRYLALARRRERLAFPLRRDGDGWLQVSLAEALAEITRRSEEATVFVDGSLFDEELEVLMSAFPGRVFALGLPDGDRRSTVRPAELEGKKAYLVFDLDLDSSYGVVGSLVKRSARRDGAEVVLIGEGAKLGDLGRRASWEEAWEAVQGLAGEDVVVIHGGLPGELADACSHAGFEFLYLPPQMNTLGLLTRGLREGEPLGEVVFVFGQDVEGLARLRERARWLVLFTPYAVPEMELSDLVVPIGDGFERGGSFRGVDGRPVVVQRVLRPPAEALDLREAFGAKSGVGS